MTKQIMDLETVNSDTIKTIDSYKIKSEFFEKELTVMKIL